MLLRGRCAFYASGPLDGVIGGAVHGLRVFGSLIIFVVVLLVSYCTTGL